MAQETNQSQAPLLCTTGCGFYGNPRNNGMCSMCYKDFLQRQNSNGRVSPPVSSSAVSSLGESLLAHCSEISTVDVPSAILPTETDSGPPSVVSSQSLLTPALTLSSEDSPAGDKDALKTEDSPGACRPATAVGSGSAASSEAGVARQSRQPGKRPSQEDFLEDGSPQGKRRLEDTDQLLDGEKASVSPGGSVEDQDKPSDKPKAKKSRCFTCRKKVGLTGFDCRCGRVFCGAHRYSDIHSCTFDYKTDAAEKIRKENPVIVGEKIQKI